MKSYVLDANAIIRFLTRGPSYEKVAALMKKAACGEVWLSVSVINWGEVLYCMARSAGLNKATSDLKALGTVVESVAVDEPGAEAAAALKLHYGLGYADCFAAALALRLKATLVTADPEFAKLGRRLKVLNLTRHASE